MNVIFTQRTKDLLFSMSVVNIIDAKHRALKRRKIVKYLTKSAEIKGLKKRTCIIFSSFRRPLRLLTMFPSRNEF